MRLRNIMKNRRLTWLAALLAAVLAFAGLAGASAQPAAAAQDPAVAGKTFTIATDTTYAPFEFRQGGKLVGIDMDLIRTIAKEKGFNVNIQSLGFAAALQALNSNQADAVIAGMSITDERKQIYDFSDPYYDSQLTFAVNKNDNSINSLGDLKGKSVAVKTGTQSEIWAKSIAQQYGFTVKSVDQSATLVELVKSHNVAAAVDDYPVMAYGISQNNGLKTVGEPHPVGSYGFAVNKGKNAALLTAFNNGLKELRANGEYDKIVAKYTGSTSSTKDAASSAAATGSESTVTDTTKELAKQAKGKHYTIATDTTFAPFEFREGGKLVGIDMDIVNAIAKSQDFDIDIQSLGFNAALQALSSNQASGVIAGMSITDERKQIYDFSDPYFQSGVQMAVAKNDTSITKYADLKGKNVTAKTGSEGESYAKSVAGKYGFTVKSVDQSATMYEMVKSGNAAAVFDDYPVLAYGISQNNGLKAVTPKVPEGSYGFAVNKGKNPELLAAFNVGLKELRDSGQYDKILTRYLGSNASASADTNAVKTVKKTSFWDLAKQSFPALMTGLRNTLIITALSFIIALILGLGFGLMRVGTNKVLGWIAKIYVAVFRGTPVLVWAFFFYFGIPQLVGHALPNWLWISGLLTLSLNSGSYLTEIIRGAIQSVDVGQTEGARSLGMTSSQTLRKVVLPQAVKIGTPSIINQLVIMLKDSSLLLTIGFADLLYQAQQLYASNFRVTETLLMVGIIYFVAITLLTWVANIADRRLNK
jgi:polar amino acid transport system substrate-binding protein